MSKFYKIISVNLLIVFFLLMIIPFLILHYFNHPSSDDWIINDIVNQNGIIGAQSVFYLTWSGRYFSNLIVSISPLYFGSFMGYKLVTFLNMALFIFVLFLLISELTKKFLNSKESLLLTLSIFFLYVYAMPTVSQAFYWYNGAIPYQLGMILIMVFLYLFAKLSNSENSNSTGSLTFFSALVLILVYGNSEMSMVICFMAISLIILSKLIIDKKINGRLILYGVITVVCVYVMMSAPGNDVRGTVYPNSHKLLPAIIVSFSSMFKNLILWLFYSPLLFITILLLPLLYKIAVDPNKKYVNLYVNPVYSLIVFSGFLYALFFTPVWSIGDVPFNRTVNIIFFVFLIGWFYNIIILIHYFSKKYNFNVERIPKYVYTFAFIITILFLFKKNNIKNAYSDLFKGRAAKYNNEQFARYDFINKSSADTLLLPNIVNKPSTVFICDITEDQGYHLNYMYARSFGKKSMYIIENDSLKKDKE